MLRLWSFTLWCSLPARLCCLSACPVVVVRVAERAEVEWAVVVGVTYVVDVGGVGGAAVGVVVDDPGG